MKQFNTIMKNWKEWLSFLKNRVRYNLKLKPIPVLRVNSAGSKMLFVSMLSLIFAISSLAYADSRLSISMAGNNDLRVEVDGRTFDLNNHTITIARIRPGYHMIKVKKDKKGLYGFFGNRREVLYSNRIYVREGYHTDITFNRFGKAFIDARKMDRNYDVNDWWGDYGRHERKDNHRWDNSQRRDNNRALSTEDFEQAKRVIRRERNDNSKSETAHNVFGRNYMTSEQVRDVCRLFRSDSYKLEFAKFAYDRTTDKFNYRVVYDVFSYKTNRRELEDFVHKHH